MMVRTVVRWWAMLPALALLVGAAAHAQESRVPYVPTPQDVVHRMLQIARVTSNDYLIDLGSGDGRIVVTAAAKHGARGFGVDINPTRIAEANENAKKAGVIDKVEFYQRDLFQTDLSQATVISMYLLPRINLDLRPKLLDLKPGTRIVSHDFSMEEWKPDIHETFYSKEKYHGAGGNSELYLWVIPAKVAGEWRWELPLRGKPQAYVVNLNQTFQMLTGNVQVSGRSVPLQVARLRGDELRLTFTADLGAGPVKHELRGKVDGNRFNGTADLSGARSQGRYDVSAVRAAAQ
ncbi:MAG: class I SAM-dependent methyltransferase [Betaproteobacteria bacterium]|nr:class I SAM-dependent methyltransferase [Betaproteobacteria bacterium]